LYTAIGIQGGQKSKLLLVLAHCTKICRGEPGREFRWIQDPAMLSISNSGPGGGLA